jgi:hypothetical protein
MTQPNDMLLSAAVLMPAWPVALAVVIVAFFVVIVAGVRERGRRRGTIDRRR